MTDLHKQYTMQDVEALQESLKEPVCLNKSLHTFEEFWIVCKWDQYYPKSGIDNIVLVTHDHNEALSVKDKWNNRADTWSDDFCEIYSSNELPWS